MRTTSSLEAFNGAINNRIVNHGNFYTFVHDLRLQEFLWSMRFVQHFQNGGKKEPQRKQYEVEKFVISFFIYLL